jgi:hypothetical protein
MPPDRIGKLHATLARSPVCSARWTGSVRQRTLVPLPSQRAVLPRSKEPPAPGRGGGMKYISTPMLTIASSTPMLKARWGTKIGARRAGRPDARGPEAGALVRPGRAPLARDGNCRVQALWTRSLLAGRGDCLKPGRARARSILIGPRPCLPGYPRMFDIVLTPPAGLPIVGARSRRWNSCQQGDLQ